MGVYNNNNGALSPIAGRGNIDGVYRANGILGAKNLLKVPYHHTTGVVLPVGGSVENAGLTYTHNADGSLSVSGTATAGSYCIFNRKQDWADCNFYGKKIKMSVTPITQGAFMQLYDTDNGVTLFRTDASTGEVEFTMPESLVNNTSWNISLNFPAGATLNGETFYSMVRLASDTDSTYQPYAKTNKELTEKAQTDYSTNEVLTGQKWIDGKPIYRKVVIIDGADLKTDFSAMTLIGSGVETLVHGEIYVLRGDGAWFGPTSYDNVSGDSAQMLLYADGTRVFGFCKATWGGATITKFRAVLEYTKTS